MEKKLPNANGFNEEPSVFNFQFNIGLIQFVAKTLRMQSKGPGESGLRLCCDDGSMAKMMMTALGQLVLIPNRSDPCIHQHSSKNGNAMRKTPNNVRTWLCGCGLASNRCHVQSMLLAGFC